MMRYDSALTSLKFDYLLPKIACFALNNIAFKIALVFARCSAEPDFLISAQCESEENSVNFSY